MKATRILAAPAAIALACAPAPGAAPVSLSAPPAAAEAPAAETPLLCEGAAGQRSALEAERAQVKREIADIALGRHVRKRKPSGGEVAAGVAGTAASVLLPFGIGALLGAAAGAGARSGKKGKTAPGPNVEAMIERQRWIDARLAELGRCP